MSKTKSLVVRTKPKPSREEILGLYDQGLGTTEVCQQLEIGLLGAAAGQARQRANMARPQMPPPATREPEWKPLVPQIQAAIAAQPDLTLDELKFELGTTFCIPARSGALKKLS